VRFAELICDRINELNHELVVIRLKACSQVAYFI
jgi:hypothetical protein